MMYQASYLSHTRTHAHTHTHIHVHIECQMIIHVDKCQEQVTKVCPDTTNKSQQVHFNM